MAMLEAREVGVVFPFRAGKRRVIKGVAGERRFVKNKKGQVTGLRAIADVNFTLKDGDRLAIVGVNGSGKSTLLRVLGGVLPPDFGQVYADGSLRGIFSLSVGATPAATGRQNILLSGLVAGRSRQEVEEKADEIAEFSELGRFLDMPFQSYSAGMKMRLLFAASTAFRPDILILDEWLSAGDARFRAKAQTRMRELADEAGVLVLAAHSSTTLKNVCNRALWLDEGRMRMIGDVDEVLDAYAAETSSAPEK